MWQKQRDMYVYVVSTGIVFVFVNVCVCQHLFVRICVCMWTGVRARDTCKRRHVCDRHMIMHE